MMAFLFGLVGIAALIIYVVIVAGLGFLILPPGVHFIERLMIQSRRGLLVEVQTLNDSSSCVQCSKGIRVIPTK